MILRWAKPKNHRAKIFHKKYRWFCGERHYKTTELKFPIKSIGGFTVNKTDKRRKKILSVRFRWLRLTTHIGGFIGCYRFTNGERTQRWFFYGNLRWFGLLGRTRAKSLYRIHRRSGRSWFGETQEKCKKNSFSGALGGMRETLIMCFTLSCLQER